MDEANRTFLGCLVRLSLEPDLAAGKVDEMLRDALEIALLTKLAQLPMLADAAALAGVAEQARERLGVVVHALEAGAHVEADRAAQVDLNMLAACMLPRAATADGGLWAGFRWRIVKRDQFDRDAFVEEYKACSRRLARWLGH